MSPSQSEDPSFSAFASRALREARSTAHLLSLRPKYAGTTVYITIKPTRDNDHDHYTASVTTEVQFPPSVRQRLLADELINASQEIKGTVDKVWEATRAGKPHGAREVCTETMFHIHKPMESKMSDDPKIKAFKNTGIEFEVYGYPYFDADKHCRCPQHIVDGSKLAREATAIFTQVYGHENSRCSSYFYHPAPSDCARMLPAPRLPSGLSQLDIDCREQYKATLDCEVQKIVTKHAQNKRMNKLEKAEACTRDVEAMMSRDPVYKHLKYELLWPDTDKVYSGPDTGSIHRDGIDYFPVDFVHWNK
jgi:hypothetical protein